MKIADGLFTTDKTQGDSRYPLKNIKNKKILLGVDKKYLSGRRVTFAPKLLEILKLEGYSHFISMVGCENCTLTFIGVNSPKNHLYFYKLGSDEKQIYKHFKREMNKKGIW